MRLVSVRDLEIGMVLGKPVYNESGKCLINANVELTIMMIDRIKSMDYEKLWISDEFDAETDYLSEELKMGAVRSIKSLFNGYSIKKPENNDKKIDTLKNVVEDIVTEIIKNQQCVIQLSNLKNFSNNMYEHAIDVARISVLIGVNLGLKKDVVSNLCIAAMLHDVGKTQIPAEILNKKTEYTEEEYELLSTHAAIGHQIVKDTKRFHTTVYVAILQHHERFDGKGYPNKLIGDKAHLFARIIKVADTYSNMRTGTPNTKSYIQSEVIEYFYADGSTKFDPEVLKIFFAKVPIYDVGQIIKLSNGKKAFVAQNNPKALARPIVRVILENNKAGEEIDLSETNSITIIQ